MQSLCQPTNDPLIIGGLRSSVVRASDQYLECHGFNSHLVLRIFFMISYLHTRHSIYYGALKGT